MGRGSRNPGCECCTTCPSETDDFNRADSTSIGADYTEVAGDWSISSNKLTTSDTDARVVYSGTTQHEDQIVTVSINGDAGDKAGIITSWLNASNYVYTEIEIGTTESTITVWKYRAGSATNEASESTPGIKAGEEGTLTVCYYHDDRQHTWFTDLSAFVRSMRMVFLDNPPNGPQWGLGTGDTNLAPVTFDDLTFERHRPL